MAGFLDTIRKGVGDAVDTGATALNLFGFIPDMGVSEAIAGGKTALTGRPQVSDFFTSGGATQPTSGGNVNWYMGGAGSQNDLENPNPALPGQTLNQGPSVLGAATIGSGAVGGAGAPNQGFLNSLLQQAGQGIQQGYDATLGQLRSNADFLRQQSGDLINQTNSTFDRQQDTFGRQRDQAMKDLDNSQQDIDSNKTDALSDLSSDLRVQMESFARMLGAMGAADSSAAGMGQYAFGRMGQQARSDIWKQANQLSTEVGRRRETVNNLFQENLRSLSDWKSDQLMAIENDFKAKNQQIEQAKMQADAQRLAQLNDIQMQIQQQALSTALQVDQRVASMAASNQQWAQQQAQNLDGLKTQLQTSLQAVGLDPIAVDPLASTAVNNSFNFGSNDIQRNSGGPGAIQVALPQNRRDENTI